MILLRFLFVLSVGAVVLYRDPELVKDPQGTYPEDVVAEAPRPSAPFTFVAGVVEEQTGESRESTDEVFPLPPGYDENDYFRWQLDQLGWWKEAGNCAVAAGVGR